jgi:hypothetical protein
MRSTDRRKALLQTCYGHHDHRGRRLYRSRLFARQHWRDHRVPVGRVRDRMVHRTAARAPPQTARRRVTTGQLWRAVLRRASPCGSERDHLIGQLRQHRCEWRAGE